MPGRTDDERLQGLVDLIVKLASGDLTARLKPSPARDNIDAVITGINLLAGELQDVHSDMERRVAERTRQLERVTIELERLALRDPLTGLANRTLLGDRLDAAVHGHRAGDRAPAVLLIDLDQFKAINDSFGHNAGDSVLVEVARRLESLDCDGCTIARLGGDEFAILLPEGSDEDAMEFAARVLHALDAPFRIGGRIVNSSASVGLRLGDDALTAELLLRDADTAMYAAKAEGRGNVQIYRPEMHAAVHDRLTIASDLADAIRGGQLFLQYQPIVNMTDGAMVGAEALVRWQHPQRGVIAPQDFVPIAESTGLIVELGRWVIREAVEQLSSWQNTVEELGSFQLNINLSPLELRRPDLDTYILKTLDLHDVPAHRLIVELSETTLMTTSAVGMGTLEVLRTAGVSIAIDDFGTGYSSISALQQLPIDAVKLDRSLIVDIATGRQERNFLEAILALIRSVGLRAVVEGVETQGQCLVLNELNCQYAQGFYFGVPSAAEDLHFLRSADSARSADAVPT